MSTDTPQSDTIVARATGRSSTETRHFLHTVLITILVSGAFYLFVLLPFESSQKSHLQGLTTQVKQEHQSTHERINSLVADRQSELSTIQSEVEKLRVTRQEVEALQRQVDEKRSAAAVTKAKTLSLQNQGQQVREELQALRVALAKWRSDYLPLMENETGRRIAASPAQTELCLSLLQRERPSDSQVSGWFSELSALMVPFEIKSAKDQDELAVTAEHVAAVKRIGDSARTAAKELESDRATLNIVVLETQKLDPGQMTLAIAKQRRWLEQQQTAAAKIAAAEKEALDRQTEVLQQLHTQRINAETELKRKQEENQIGKLSGQIQEQDDIKKRAEQERIRQQQRAALLRDFEADRAEIDTYLMAFTQTGSKYRGVNPGLGPMSFSSIQGEALKRTSSGRQALAIIVGNGERAQGPLPRFQGGMTAAHTEACDRAQQLLTKYGQLMVEKGLLAP